MMNDRWYQYFSEDTGPENPADVIDFETPRLEERIREQNARTERQRVALEKKHADRIALLISGISLGLALGLALVAVALGAVG